VSKETIDPVYQVLLRQTKIGERQKSFFLQTKISQVLAEKYKTLSKKKKQ
ncbi:hypothetical protein BSL78_27626, partial [Apostichopus japonicus]